MKKVPKIYYIVLELLSEKERCRNDDQYLICNVWLRLHTDKFKGLNEGDVIMVALKDIANNFETAETITRTRRKIQNDLGLYPPTNPSVVKGRRIKEEVWRENMSNNFTQAQAKAIMEIYIRAKNASERDIKKIKQDIINKHNI